MWPRPVPLLVLLAACGETLELPREPVEGDRAPGIVEMGPSPRWGGETIELKGVNLGLPGERVRVVFGGGVETGADQQGLGDSLTVVVPPDAVDGKVRVITTLGTADSPEPLRILGADQLLLGTIVGSLDLRLPVDFVREVRTQPRSFAVSHENGGLLFSGDGLAGYYPRVLTMLPGGRPVSAERIDPSCAGPSIVVRSADLATDELVVCLGARARQPKDIVANASPDGRWLVAISHQAVVWTIDLEATGPVARELEGLVDDTLVGLDPVGGARFVVGGRRRIVLVDAEAHTARVLRSLPISARPIRDLVASGNLVATFFSGGDIELSRLDADTLVFERTLEPLLPARYLDRGGFLDADRGLVGAVAEDGTVLFWDLHESSTLPKASLVVPDASALMSNGDGSLVYVTRLGGFVTVDAGNLRVIASVDVPAQLGAMRLALRSDGFSLVVHRYGAHDVLFIDGATYFVKAVPIPDDVVSLVTTPDGGPVWVLGQAFLWKVTPDGAERWLAMPDGSFAAKLELLQPEGHLLAFLQYGDGVDVQWIDPSANLQERLVGTGTLSGTYFVNSFPFPDRLVAIAEASDGSGVHVDVFEVALSTAEEPLRLVESHLTEPFTASVRIGQRVLLYEPAIDGVPMLAQFVDPATGALSDLFRAPFIGAFVSESPSGRFLLWREGGGQLEYRLESATLDTVTLEQLNRGPVVPLGFAGEPTVVLPRGDSVVVVDRSADRLYLVR